MGRPKIDEARDVIIRIRLTKEEAKILEEVSTMEGVTRSECIRSLVLPKCKKKLDSIDGRYSLPEPVRPGMYNLDTLVKTVMEQFRRIDNSQCSWLIMMSSKRYYGHENELCLRDVYYALVNHEKHRMGIGEKKIKRTIDWFDKYVDTGSLLPLGKAYYVKGEVNE